MENFYKKAKEANESNESNDEVSDETNYDSTKDTEEHIAKVRQYLNDAAEELKSRGLVHDDSKLKSPEKEIFDEFTPKLKDSTYNSPEYKQFLKDMDVALQHHYENNTHHPEHWENGINDMDLFDLIEMFIDWKAATERHDDGDIMNSIKENAGRFKLSPQLQDIMKNTAIRLGWADNEK